MPAPFTLPFDVSRFRRIFDPYDQSKGRSHGGWEPDPMHPPLPPYPLNPDPLTPPPMLQAPPEPREPVVGQPQRTPQTPINPPRIPPVTSSPRTIPQPPYPVPQGQSPLDFPPGGPANPSQFDINADIRKTMPPRPPMPTGDTLPPRAPTPAPTQPTTPPFSTDYPYIYGAEEPTLGLNQGAGTENPMRPGFNMKPGTITNENMHLVPPGLPRPSLDMGGYTNQMTDISGQAQANAPDQWQGGPPPTEEEQINNEFSKFKFDTTMQDRLTALLDQFPQRQQDFSKWRKFGSFLTGFGQGPEAQEVATYAPFYRQVADWRQQLDPALKGAELERQGNINLRQLLHNMEMERTANRRVDVQEEAEARRERVRLDNVEKEKRKDEVNRLKANDANWSVESDKDGNVFMIHPRLGKKDMGINSGDVSEQQKYLWDLDKIRTRGQVASENRPERWHYYYDYSQDPNAPRQMRQNMDDGTIEEVGSQPTGPTTPTKPTSTPQGQFGSLGNVNTGFQSAPTKSTTPVPAAQGKPESGTQKQANLEIQVARAKQQFPDFADYIEWNDETKLPEITIPGKSIWSSFTGGDEMTPYDWNTYEQIGKFIFGPSFKRMDTNQQSETVTTPNVTGTATTRTTSKGNTVRRID